jgi:signal transduction histidine kinase
MSFSETDNYAMQFSDPEAIGAISRGLHRTAQPLTVLQGTLELALLKPHTREEYQSIITRAMEQSQRVSDYFAHVRELVHLQESVPEVGRFSLVDVVTSVAATFAASLAADGIELQMQLEPEGDRACFVMGSETRIANALEIILSNLPHLAGKNTKIDLSIDIESNNVQVQLKRSGPGLQAREEGGKGMAHYPPLDLAQAMVSSAGGRLKFVNRPFAVLMSLAKAKELNVVREPEGIECAHV